MTPPPRCKKLNSVHTHIALLCGPSEMGTRWSLHPPSTGEPLGLALAMGAQLYLLQWWWFGWVIRCGLGGSSFLVIPAPGTRTRYRVTNTCIEIESIDTKTVHANTTTVTDNYFCKLQKYQNLYCLHLLSQ